MEKDLILFSPIGSTDPIRKMHDGPCIHIIRNYHPYKVFLFLTKEMGDKEKAFQFYTKPIKKVAPDIEIEYIYTDIVDAHLYDSFMQSIPNAVYDVHERYPEAEILMNISSGTPQMTTTMAIISMQESWFRPVQVMTPVHASNQNNKGDDQADIDTMMETNMDDEDGAENRCDEPKLRALHYYDDRNRINSLIGQFEYRAAHTIARQNPDIPAEVAKLLDHAYWRNQLQGKKAKETLSKYEGISLFPFTGRKSDLIEYFLTIQIEQKKRNLSRVLTQVIPFMYELLLEYVKNNTNINLDSIADRKGGQHYICRKNKIRDAYPGMLQFLDTCYPGTGFKNDSDLSAKIIMQLCEYADNSNLAKDKAKHTEMLESLDRVEKVIRLRNEVAHNMLDIDEEEFRNRTQMNSDALIEELFKLLRLTYGDDIRNLRNVYTQINQWITKLLKLGKE